MTFQTKFNVGDTVLVSYRDNNNNPVKEKKKIYRISIDFCPNREDKPLISYGFETHLEKTIFPLIGEERCFPLEIEEQFTNLQ